MKKILLILLFFTAILQSATTKDDLFIFANNNPSQIELKWFTSEYSSQYTYKLYRKFGKENQKKIATVKPVSYNILKKRGYDEDYIFMVYPFKNTKSFDDRIKVLKIEEQVQGFRLLKWMRSKSFAVNLGQYFVDKSVEKDKLYVYKIEAYKKGKIVFEKLINTHTYKKKGQVGFLWVNSKNTTEGVELNWDVNAYFAYYNIYRKLNDEKKFSKLNKELIFISLQTARKAKFLYVDKNLKIGQKATYYIRKIDMFSKEGKASREVQGFKKEQSKKPKSVSGIFVKNNDKKIMLRWKSSSKVIGYNIYRSSIYEGGFVKLNKEPIKKSVYFDKNFLTGKNYYYYITALNMKGESNPSTTMLAFARDTTPPARPANLKATVKNAVVLLSWDKVKDKGLLGYRVYESMDIDAKQWSLVAKKEIKENKYKYKKLKTLSRFPYFYRVSAVDKTKNESQFSNIIKIQLPDATPPKQPFIISYLSYTNKIVLEWNKIVVYDFNHYNIYRKVGKKLKRLNNKPIFLVTFTDTKPLKGENQYIITAVDKSGNESTKTKTKKILLKDNIPVKIENFKLSKVKDGVKISFTCKDSDYAGFKLFRSSGKILNYFNISNFVKSKSFIDKTTSKNTKYFYMIKAYDKAGNIKESNVLKMMYK
jgi:hypothetical protein